MQKPNSKPQTWYSMFIQIPCISAHPKPEVEQMAISSLTVYLKTMNKSSLKECFMSSEQF